MLILLSQSERRCLCTENVNCFQKIIFKYFKWEFNSVCLCVEYSHGSEEKKKKAWHFPKHL